MTWNGQERRKAARETMSEKDMKNAMKQAIKEWLDEQFAKFGRWSFYGLLSLGLAALVYFILTANGWHK